jgi:hypothetical protein
MVDFIIDVAVGMGVTVAVGLFVVCALAGFRK